jgi:dephospho-CoA kinase
VTPGGPRRVGLTGGIASGKSYCLARFADLGVPTIDADVLARDAVAPGTAALAAIVARFGRGILQPDGRLDRNALGRRVFADAAARHDLERIVHPVVHAAIGNWFAQTETDTGSRFPEGVRETDSRCRFSFAIADVPLLYETGREADFDGGVIVAVCTPEQQLERLLARGGLSEAEARQRIGAQQPLAEKARRADYVIDTSGTKDVTDRQVVDVFERLSGCSSTASRS